MFRKTLAFCSLFLFLPLLIHADSSFIYNQRGIIYNLSGQHEKAIEEFEKALKNDPDNEAIKNNLATAYANFGVALSQKRDFRKAETYLKDAIDFNPEEPSHHLNLATVYLNQGKWSEAERSLKECLRFEPNNILACNYLGNAYYYQGDLKKAISQWEKVLRLDPKNEFARERLTKAKRELSIEKDFEKDRYYHFSVKFEGEKHEEAAERVLDILADAYHDVGVHLDYQPEGTVQVIIYSKKNFSDLGYPGWAAGIYDGKIRLSLSDTKKNLRDLKAVLYHEYTHAALFYLTSGKIPTWLNEGLAQYEAKQWDRNRAKRLKEALRKKELVPLRDLENWGWLRKYEKIDLAYLQSYAACDYLIDRFRMSKMHKLLDLISSGTKPEAALKKVMGRDYKKLQEEVESSIGKY